MSTVLAASGRRKSLQNVFLKEGRSFYMPETGPMALKLQPEYLFAHREENRRCIAGETA